MTKYYIDTNGARHDFVGKSTKRIDETPALDLEYAQAAAQMAKDYNSDIFYCLKQFDGIGNFIEARYFAIPIESEEVGNIIDQFGESCYIGIQYCENAPSPSLSPTRQSRSLGNEPMSGVDFEKHCAEILSNHGFSNIKLTPKTGDHGADIIAYKGGELYVIQCKRYSGNVGFKAVQEVHTAKDLYHAQKAIVMTNSSFTQQAKDDAKRLGVNLYEKVRV